MHTTVPYSALPLPVFDVDDLSFFHQGGLALRHAELELGEKEAKEGGYGDAISLANYGRGSKEEKPIPNVDACKRLQAEVELFIRKTYKAFHRPFLHFTDAAFLLIDRGIDARDPYDYDNYPLGKCGSQDFGAKQVVSLMKTDQYSNEDVKQAVHNTLTTLKGVTRQLKLQKAKKLADYLKKINETNPTQLTNDLYKLLNEVIIHYSNNVFINDPIFFRIAELSEQLNNPEKNDIETQEKLLNELKEWIKAIDISNKKGENLIRVIHKPTNFDALSPQELTRKLVHFIKNQNLEKVQECLKRLPKDGFYFDLANRSTYKNPLLVAAMHEDVSILQAVYEFNPKEYDRIVESSNLETPLFAAVREANFTNMKYLLAQRNIAPRDLSYDKEHILTKIVQTHSHHPQAGEMIKFLLEKGVTIDNSNIEDINTHPLIRGLIPAFRSDIALENLILLLPLSDSRAKYTAIYKITDEIFHASDYDSDIDRLLKFRQLIFSSLTKDERNEIRQKFYPKAPAELFKKIDPFEARFGYSLSHATTTHDKPLDEFLNKEDESQKKAPFAIIHRHFFATGEVIEPITTAKQKPTQQPKVRFASDFDSINSDDANETDVEEERTQSPLPKDTAIELLNTFKEEKLKKADDPTFKITKREKEKYKASINNFYDEGIRILALPVNPDDKAKKLKESAHDQFRHRHWGRRVLADSLIVISAIVGIGIAVGAYRKTHGKTFFFSTEKTEREKSFDIVAESIRNSLKK